MLMNLSAAGKPDYEFVGFNNIWIKWKKKKKKSSTNRNGCPVMTSFSWKCRAEMFAQLSCLKQRHNFSFQCKRAAFGDTDKGQRLSFPKWIHWKLILTSILVFLEGTTKVVWLILCLLNFAFFPFGYSLKCEVAGSIPGAEVFLHRVCMFPMCLRGFSPGILAHTHSPKTWLIGKSKLCVGECECLFLLTMWPSLELMTSPRCTIIFPLMQLW